MSNENLVLQHEASAVAASDWLLALHMKISRAEGNELNKFDFLKGGFVPWGQYIGQLLSHSNILLLLEPVRHSVSQSVSEPVNCYITERMV
jgi:hypothetical protein